LKQKNTHRMQPFQYLIFCWMLLLLLVSAAQ